MSLFLVGRKGLIVLVMGDAVRKGLIDGRRVFISFGGLLLYLQGPYKKLTQLRIDYVYLLLKK